MKNRPAIHVFLLLLVLGGGAAYSAELTFSPAPPVTGEPVTLTFKSVAVACEDVGSLKVLAVQGNRIDLEVTPPGCPVLPIGVLEYTASVTVDPLAAGTYSVSVFQDAGSSFVLLANEAMEVKAPPVCQATETSLCLTGSRFEVTGEWTDFAGNQGPARAVPDDFGGLGNYGMLWFFTQDNPEMVVKILDGCSNNGYYWVFLSPASTVEYRITVHDVVTGQEKVYGKALNVVPRLIADTRAFACAAP